MSENNTNIKLNKLPAPTFRYLKMNYAEAQQASYSDLTPKEADFFGCSAVFDGVVGSATGCGKELSELLDSCGINPRKLVAELDNATARCCYSFPKGDTAARIEIEAPAGKGITVTQLIDSQNSGRAALQTFLNAEEGARIHLIQVIDCGAGFQFINDIGTAQQDRASVEITQIYLNGRETIAGIFAGLSGCKSEFRNDIAYLLKGSEKLDINLVASHKGRKTQTEINARGVLSEDAQKIFRGTIDFLNGASGAKGAENEEVLMMNEGVVNKTVPLILCAEEDVEGSHGASIGKPDENHVFYLMSRGLSREEIYRIMARAKLEAAMRRIDDSKALAWISKRIGGADADEQEYTDGES